MSDKSVETPRSEIRFSSVLETFPHPSPFPQRLVTAQTTEPTQHWIGGPGVLENQRWDVTEIE